MADLVSVQVKGNVGTIEDNLDAVELCIREKVQEYSMMVITEDSVKNGKKFLADIRKEKKALDDDRKAIKERWMAPYEAFEKRAKQIISLYDEPVNVINGQLAEYEEKRRQAKRQGIQKAYDFVKGDLEEWLPLERIYNSKWENATYSEKKIREDMERLFDQTKVSISTIKSMGSEFEKDALDKLKETGSLQEAIAVINDLQKQKERFMEQAREEAEHERLAKEEVEKKASAMQASPALNDTLSVPLENGEEEEPGKPEMPGETELLFASEKMLTVVVKVGENDFGTLKETLEEMFLEYEVR
ncbi:DUF1351 domain-containing protein [Lachnospiraceae bacterium 38-14]